jgi:hypothetical protein
MVTMEHNNPKSQFSKAHLTTSNLSNFKVIEAIGLKIVAHQNHPTNQIS